MTNNITFNAFEVRQTAENQFIGTITEKKIGDLPHGELLIRVHYSSLNYKDALSASGNRGVTKNYPHTPGIDAAGVVEHSDDERFAAGDKVIVTGNDLGMNTSGGFGQYIRVPAEWAVKLPENLTLKESMIYGTAGFTAAAMFCRLSAITAPENGKIIVSGGTGGVGSMAVAILAKTGYDVSAISGKKQEYEFLQRIGAQEIIARDEFLAMDNKPLLKAQFAGGIDTAGGAILENMLKIINTFGCVATCGSVAGADLNLTVFPFILRGVSLIGMSSQNYPNPLRQPLWNKMATEWKPEHISELYTEISINQLDEHIKLILAGKLKGRTIVNLLQQ
ncbi:MAG: YhdH/YhfP family quinone oxidoreductase [Prevotellaceae bacterium]|jgi:putative YhdH/YhfP family quinone oxidoreductase|nr:YhdH/YhfP family quinone oxidoreductase [Prevotellaceae bacterium]